MPYPVTAKERRVLALIGVIIVVALIGVALW